jgi:CRP-like cAMP-binding protein
MQDDARPHLVVPGEYRQSLASPVSGPGFAPSSRAPLALDCIARPVAYRRGECLQSSDEQGESLYRLWQGAAKTFALLASGRQQTMDFLLMGYFFAFGCRETEPVVAEVLAENTVIATYRQDDIRALAAEQTEVASLLVDIAFGAVMRLQRRMLTVSNHMRTTQRVGSFLWEISERLMEPGSESFILPISRYDIADYLGMSVESVSRALGKLNESGAIRLVGVRNVAIVDVDALKP